MLLGLNQFIATIITFLSSGMVVLQQATGATQAAAAATQNSGGDSFEKLILPAIISLITSAITAIATSLSFGLHFIRERRATATFGFYASFRIVLKDLQDLLKKEENPYIALYEETVRFELKNAGAEGVTVLKKSEDYLKPFITIAERIRKLLLETDNNVYPNAKTRIEWYNNQYILYTFTQIILDKTGIEKEQSNRKVHTENKLRLEQTIRFLLSEIDSAQLASPRWLGLKLKKKDKRVPTEDVE